VKDSSLDGTTALMLAIINAHFELASFLLDRGADANVPDAKHGSTLHAIAWVRRQAFGIGMGSSPIYPRIQTGDMDSLTLAEKLLARGADPNIRFKIENPKFATDVKDSVSHRSRGDYVAVNPPNFAVPIAGPLTWSGATPFWVASKNADVPLMRLLAAHGANPRLSSDVGVTPVMAAAGAGFMQGEHPGTEAEALAATKLALELSNDDVNAVADFGANERVDIRFSGLTALHGAAERGANSIVEFLVDRGAKLDLKTKEGWTPYNVAAGITIGMTVKNSPDTAALLRKLMTDRGLPIEEYHVEDVFVEVGR
jgi:ankyrin repeat protein